MQFTAFFCKILFLEGELLDVKTWTCSLQVHSPKSDLSSVQVHLVKNWTKFSSKFTICELNWSELKVQFVPITVKKELWVLMLLSQHPNKQSRSHLPWFCDKATSGWSKRTELFGFCCSYYFDVPCKQIGRIEEQLGTRNVYIGTMYDFHNSTNIFGQIL